MEKIKVGILGATGAVGQRFVKLLENHPWFEVNALTGSDRSIGKTYLDACHWVLPGNIPDYAREMTILPSEPGFEAQLAFSALPSNQANEVEQELAKRGYAVCSNASTHRMWEDVPLLIPEVNPDHTALIAVQRRNRGWKGFIVTNPNCTSTGLTIALRPLHNAFKLKKVFVVSMQAVSGAGYPGVASLDILDNVIPFISGEEEKVETEPQKMLGTFSGQKIKYLPIQISAHTNRVAVTDGHMVCVSVEFAMQVSPEEASAAMSGFHPPAIVASLPSAPLATIEISAAPDRPQPRRDRDAGNGMTTIVGRVRVDPIFHIKFVNYSHNTIRGAAGGAILNGELLVSQGLL
jgi:aspartate-semialdehyde dehydrogenase